MKPNKQVSKYMSSLGKKGGKAKGTSKVRGDSEYYRRIRSMRESKNPSATHGKEGCPNCSPEKNCVLCAAKALEKHL